MLQARLVARAVRAHETDAVIFRDRERPPRVAERAANPVPMIDFAEMPEEFRGLTGHVTSPGLREFSRKPMARPLATLYRLIWQGVLCL